MDAGLTLAQLIGPIAAVKALADVTEVAAGDASLLQDERKA